MGNWGYKIFESDVAGDWITHLGSLDISCIANALTQITECDRSEYLESDTCEEALAAAELLAAAGGLPTTNLPDEAKEWLQKEQPRVTAKLVQQARRVLVRVRTKSELKELWEEGKDGAKWHSELQNLDGRLAKLPDPKLAPKYAQPKKKPKRIKLEPGDVFAMPFGYGAYGVCKVLWFSTEVKFHMWIAIYDTMLRKPEMPPAFGRVLKVCFTYPDTVTSDDPNVLIPLKSFTLPGGVKVGSVKLSKEEAQPPKYQVAGTVKDGDKWIRNLNYNDKKDTGFLLPDGNSVSGYHLRRTLQALLIAHRWWEVDGKAENPAPFWRAVEACFEKVREKARSRGTFQPSNWYFERYSLAQFASEVTRGTVQCGDGSAMEGRNEEWQRFKAKFKNGMELWRCGNNENAEGKGRLSLLILEQNKVIAEYLLWRN